ncbi:MAG: 4'-phosphopantetheinyl transferase superfamily protein [Lachnospiraceae bacterium]|jgi:4'-phosphopantetheinyl transferase|nr:4'-phosphopantetheinyl transferase superfamily protein [Lachnospiraceae bacterium]
MITIYCLDISKIDTETYKTFYSIVTKERKTKADHFRFQEDSKRCVFGEILLRFRLSQLFDHVPKLTITYNAYGKAYIKNLKNFFYNISHSGHWVVLAQGSSEIGVDIEKIAYHFDLEQIVNGYFSCEEKQCVLFPADEKMRAKRFTQIWTLKESYMKYLGTGLFTDLNSFSTNLFHGYVKDSKNNIDKQVKLKNYLLNNDYSLSVCSKESPGIIQFITVSQLLHHLSSLLHILKSE